MGDIDFKEHGPLDFQEHAIPPQPAAPESWGHYAGRTALETLPVGGMIAGGMLGAPEGGVGAVPGAALGFAAGKQVERLGKKYLLGDKDANVATEPFEQAKQTGTDVLNGAAAEMGGQVLGKGIQTASDAVPDSVKSYIGNRLEGMATNPVPEKVANATNLVGAGKNIVSKIADKLGDALPQTAKPAADVASGIAGRAGIYKTPLGVVQGVSDLARGVGFAQKGLASALDSGALTGTAQPAASAVAGTIASQAGPAHDILASSKLWTTSQLSRLFSSPYGQTLSKAAESGGSDGVSTTHYILQQTDPGYQQLLKDEQQ